MNDLVEFLRARLDEREQLARDAAGSGQQSWVDTLEETPDGENCYWAVRVRGHRYGFIDLDDDLPSASRSKHIATNDPASALVDIEAKRRIIDRVERYLSTHFGDDSSGEVVCEEILEFLALPFVDHPDYQVHWRP